MIWGRVEKVKPNRKCLGCKAKLALKGSFYCKSCERKRK